MLLHADGNKKEKSQPQLYQVGWMRRRDVCGQTEIQHSVAEFMFGESHLPVWENFHTATICQDIVQM